MNPFEDFWTASRFSPLHQRRLGERLRDFRPQPPLIDPLVLPGEPHPLPRPKDRLQRLFRNRRSTRDFGPDPLSVRQLGTVLGALAEENGRSYPSAGGLHPLRAYAFLHRVDHPLNGRAVRYDAKDHALQDAGPCPDDLPAMLGTTDTPPLTLVLLLADEPTMAKYGQRGGRFGLLEAGAAAQSVCLRLARAKLGGYLLGGVADHEVLTRLGLRDHPVRVATAIACGRMII
jgi:nitroreductase